MADRAKPTPKAEVTPIASKNDDSAQRSTIEFPYNDLDDAVKIAKAIANNAGVSCALDQLAAYLGVSISGPFRLRVSNARMFGITNNEKGAVNLTDLGRMIADPKTESAARADAFLNVELYKALFEKYRGFALPSAAGLEREMQNLGVSAKQTDKARQTFTRSARQAGFFAHGEDRLVRPATTPLPKATTSDFKGKADILPPGGGGGRGDGGGGDLSHLDPLLLEYLKKIPAVSDGWPSDKRVRWFRTFAMIASEVYDGEGAGVEIEIKAS